MSMMVVLPYPFLVGLSSYSCVYFVLPFFLFPSSPFQDCSYFLPLYLSLSSYLFYSQFPLVPLVVCSTVLGLGRLGFLIFGSVWFVCFHQAFLILSCCYGCCSFLPALEVLLS